MIDFSVLSTVVGQSDDSGLPDSTSENSSVLPSIRGRYRFERDMLEILASSTSALFGRPTFGVTTLREPNFGACIPDLLVGVWALDSTSGVSLSPRFPYGLVDSFLAHFVASAGEIEIDSVRLQLGLTTNATVQSLTKLQRHGLVDWVYADVVASTHAITALMNTEIIAIEAKLTRWREALEQAASYKSFCDQSYVALDAGQIRVTETLISEFRSAGVGLLLCDGHAIRCAITAVTHSARSPQRARAALKLAASRAGVKIGRSWQVSGSAHPCFKCLEPSGLVAKV